MELQQFVASALKQLIGAIDEVKEFAKSKGAEINPSDPYLGRHRA
jgi:hypothetical protein